MAERLEQTSKSRYRLRSQTTSSERIRNWSLSSDSVENAIQFEEPLSSISLSVVAFVYGGLHLLDWSAPFHTRTEEIPWKISGISIASIGLVSISYTILVSAEDYDRFIRSRVRTRRIDYDKCIDLHRLIELIFHMVVKLLGGSYLLLYLFARVYLVVECFIEVAYLPDSAFTTPVFTRYIPHFG